MSILNQNINTISASYDEEEESYDISMLWVDSEFWNDTEYWNDNY